jgi:hypothetical protein
LTSADAKTLAENALRVLRVVDKLSPPMQAEVLSVAFAIVNVSVNRWNFEQQQRKVQDE